MVVPAIQSVKVPTEDKTLEPLAATNREAVKMSLVILPVTRRPLVIDSEPENELDPVLTEVKVPEMEALPPNYAVPRVSRSPEISKSLVVEM